MPNIYNYCPFYGLQLTPLSPSLVNKSLTPSLLKKFLDPLQLSLSRRSVTSRDLSNTGSPAGFPKTRAKKRRGMLRIKSAMLSLCLCECGPHSPIAALTTKDHRKKTTNKTKQNYNQQNFLKG